MSSKKMRRDRRVMFRVHERALCKMKPKKKKSDADLVASLAAKSRLNAIKKLKNHSMAAMRLPIKQLLIGSRLMSSE